jgi:hypothetical protein
MRIGVHEAIALTSILRYLRVARRSPGPRTNRLSRQRIKTIAYLYKSNYIRTDLNALCHANVARGSLAWRYGCTTFKRPQR